MMLVKKKKKKAITAPALLILCDTAVVATNTISGGLTKRKQAPSGSHLSVTKQCVSLFAPIETQHKQASTLTGVPAGRMNEEVAYSLSRYIEGDIDCASSSSNLSLGDNDGVVDEEFVKSLTLLLFRKELMVLAGAQFPEEYGVERKILGPKCNLFVQK